MVVGRHPLYRPHETALSPRRCYRRHSECGGTVSISGRLFHESETKEALNFGLLLLATQHSPCALQVCCCRPRHDCRFFARRSEGRSRQKATGRLAQTFTENMGSSANPGVCPSIRQDLQFHAKVVYSVETSMEAAGGTGMHVHSFLWTPGSSHPACAIAAFCVRCTVSRRSCVVFCPLRCVVCTHAYTIVCLTASTSGSEV